MRILLGILENHDRSEKIRILPLSLFDYFPLVRNSLIVIRISKSENLSIDRLIDETDLKDLNRFGGFIVCDVFEQGLVTEVHGILDSLFNLSIEVKKKFLANKSRDPLSAGFSPYGSARALDTGIPNLLETWDINGPIDRWPKQLISGLKIVEDFQMKLKGCSAGCLDVLAGVKGLKVLKEHAFRKTLSEGIHLIHYFPVSDEFPTKAVRQSVHEDNSLITLIPKAHPDRSPLLVQDNLSDTLVPIHIEETDCIVQFGTALKILSQGKLRSCVHTVRDPRRSSEPNVSRYSTPYFVAPCDDFELSIKRGSNHIEKIRFGEMAEQYFQSIFGEHND